MGTMKNWIIGFLVGCALILAQGAHAETPSDPDNAFLNALTGDWSMTGTTLGKPIKYSLHGERVLAGGFVRLALRDTKIPSEYQADIYIGYDAKKKDFIAHWLDQFGAAGARVVATGHCNGETLVLLFPYEDGGFRDTFTYDPTSKTWSWLLETQDARGKWSTFARYDLARK
jgi:hypothetical protein